MHLERFATKLFENSLYAFPGFFMPDFLATEIQTQGINREIITCRAQAPGGDEEVSRLQANVYSLDDLWDIIPYAHLTRELPTMLIEECGNPRAVGIVDLTDHEFVANREDGGFSGGFHAGKVPKCRMGLYVFLKKNEGFGLGARGGFVGYFFSGKK